MGQLDNDTIEISNCHDVVEARKREREQLDAIPNSYLPNRTDTLHWEIVIPKQAGTILLYIYWVGLQRSRTLYLHVFPQ